MNLPISAETPCGSHGRVRIAPGPPPAADGGGCRAQARTYRRPHSDGAQRGRERGSRTSHLSPCVTSASFRNRSSWRRRRCRATGGGTGPRSPHPAPVPVVAVTRGGAITGDHPSTESPLPLLTPQSRRASTHRAMAGDRHTTRAAVLAHGRLLKRFNAPLGNSRCVR